MNTTPLILTLKGAIAILKRRRQSATPLRWARITGAIAALEAAMQFLGQREGEDADVQT